MAEAIKILIVEDNVMCRDRFKVVLSQISDVEVLTAAPNGKTGLDRLKQSKPDMVILGTGLKDMSSVDFTRAALEASPGLGIIVAARNDPIHADQAIHALEAGAFDFMLKPEIRCHEEVHAKIKRILTAKIRCYSIKRYSKLAQSYSPARRAAAVVEREDNSAAVEEARAKIISRFGGRQFEALLIGVSTGGPEALSQLIPMFPSTFALPIVIVLHMPKIFTGSMAAALDRKSLLKVKEAEEGEALQAGTVYLAPGGRHVVLEGGTRRRTIIAFNDGMPENGCKPAADVLFRSAAEILKEKAIAIVLTGMGEDGTRGLAALKEYDIPVLAQDEATSIVWGMPGSAVRAGYVDEILPLESIAGRVMEIVEKS